MKARMDTDKPSAAQPQPLPLPARFSRGERENHVAKSLSKVCDFSSLYYGFNLPQKGAECAKLFVLFVPFGGKEL
jgi:hypothetical protein